MTWIHLYRNIASFLGKSHLTVPNAMKKKNQETLIKKNEP